LPLFGVNIIIKNRLQVKFYNPVIVKSCSQIARCSLVGWWVGFGCGWAKLNPEKSGQVVVFLCRQVRWQNTSFNFAKGWRSFIFLSMF
jgi:hypothetical protein